MSFRVEWSRSATKDLLSIEKKQRLMIIKWVQENLEGCENPKAILGSKALQGTKAGWRYRVGAYRLLTTINDGALVIDVVRVGHRQGVYKTFQGACKKRGRIWVDAAPLTRGMKATVAGTWSLRG